MNINNEVQVVTFEMDGVPTVRVFSNPDDANAYNNAVVNTLGKSSIFTETVDRGLNEIRNTKFFGSGENICYFDKEPESKIKPYYNSKEVTNLIKKDEVDTAEIFMDKPRFLGIGSFDNELGNTSCYIRRGCNLILIDCGYDVFQKIKKVIDKSEYDENTINNITIYITHLHGDHCGSLSSLIEYCYFVKNIKVEIEYPETEKMVEILDCHLVKREMYSVQRPNNSFKLVHSIYEHLYSYGYELSLKNDTFIFAWDCCDIHPDVYNRFIELIKQYDLNSCGFEKVYLFHDICFAEYPGNKHTNYTKLLNIFKDHRELIYPVHLDNKKELDKIMIANGFGDINEFM